jgi:hypothetical protein
MDALLDTTWYSKYGYQHLAQNEEQLRLIATFLHFARFVESEVISRTPEEISEDGGRTRALETKLIWNLLTAIRRIPGPQPYGNNVPYADDTAVADEKREREEAIANLSILEAILTRSVLSFNPMASFSQDDFQSPAKRGQINFWSNAALAVTIRDENHQTAEAIYNAVVNAYRFVYNRENRHCVYAMLYIRLMQSRVAGFPDHMPPPQQSFDQVQNALGSLQSNLEFIAEGGGCTSTMRRIVHMFRRSWYCR